MKTSIYLTTGKLFFGAAILAIGIIHLVAAGFPAGLLPVAVSVPGRSVMAYISGTALIVAAVLIFVKKFTLYGALLTGAIFLVFLLLLHIPLLIINIKNGGEWTGTFEVFSLIGGSLVLAGATLSPKNNATGYKLAAAGRYMLAMALFVFGILHFEYEKYIITLIPTWIPFLVFWSYVVMIGFFAAFVSFIIKMWVRLSSLLLALMYLIWVLIVHAPRVITGYKIEPEWTSLFIALAMSGIGLLIAGYANYETEK